LGCDGAVGALADGWEEDGEEAPEAFFAVCWRSSLRIFDDSGVTFGAVLVAGGFVSAFGDRAGEEVFGGDFRAGADFVEDSGPGLLVGKAFDALVVAFVVLGAALVDFALVAVFFAPSGTATSTGSVMTFFGLPLFLATSVDILRSELVVPKNSG
jgi:hypothetical protein